MKKQILIVEDEQDTVELLRYNLEKENYKTLIACNGEEAIEVAQSRMPDLILLDIMLPELNGWEVCKILRESIKGKLVPIIMMTALSDEQSRIKGLTLGADDYLTKPFSLKELLLKVRNHIDRQQMIEYLRSREQEQDTSLRYLVHELQNAMTAIGGFSSLALRKEDPATYLRTIKTSAAHVQSLLNDASLLARLEKTGETLPAEQVDIAALVSEVVDLFRDQAKIRRIEIVTVNAGAELVKGNKTAMRQVLANLLSNAIKYSAFGRRICICFDARNNWIDISIKDDGGGIPHDELSRIFEKYYRVAGSKNAKGAGLGLYIVKLLTEAMGGKVTVVSNPGSGSTFTVSFIKANVAALHSAQDVA
jgi:signal transduction histidine kinase